MSSKRVREKVVLSRQAVASRKKGGPRKAVGGGALPGPRRALAGVLLLTASVLTLLAVVSFDVHDRLGPGFRNWVGPIGHAVAELVRGVFGVTATVPPAVGLYVSALVFTGDGQRRRWAQGLALALLLCCAAVLAELGFQAEPGWVHSPGGLVGRALSGVLVELFSTPGTVVLVSAVAAAAFIVGTEYAFVALCAWLWSGAVKVGGALAQAAARLVEAQRTRLAEAWARRQEAQAQDEAFLDELEEGDDEAPADEDSPQALALAAEAALQEGQREEAVRQRALALQEKEEQRLVRERLKVEREAARLARDAIRAARLKEKDPASRASAVAALVPGVVNEVQATPALPGDPAWAHTFLARTGVEPPPAPGVRRPGAGPTIVEPPRLSPESVPVTGEEVPVEEVVLATAPLEPVPPARPGEPAALASFTPHQPVIVEPKAPPRPTRKKEPEPFELFGGRTSFQVPPLDVLEMVRKERTLLDKEAYLQTAERLTAKLRDFGIEGEVVEIRPGPVVTMYEFRPAPGVKISKIASLADDLAMAMEAMRVRIVAPIPGKGVVGIEVPNRERETVFLKEVAEQDVFQRSASRLTMCLGKDIEGMPYILDLAKAPHLLIAGTTGSGKSVSVNAMIMSILLKSTPEEVRFIMVDPKMLELSVYEGIPHLLLPVVTDPRKAAVALQWAVEEMTRRYRLLADAGVKKISQYNELVDAEAAAALAPSAPTPTPAPAAQVATAPTSEAPAEPPRKARKLIIVDVAEETASPPPPPAEASLGVPSPVEPPEDPREVEVQAAADEVLAEAEIRVNEADDEALSAPPPSPPGAEAVGKRTKLPYIVVIIDELADLMMVASKEVETSIARLAQMARAAGIHLMVATQRPSTDVVTGVIKANFPTRISFMLRSKPDSMTILGTIGAEALLGMGDMLIMPPTSAHMSRVHGCFVSEVEIKRVVDLLKAQGKPVYDESILEVRDEGDEDGGEDDLSDELYDQALSIVSEMRAVSISMLQRKMRIGYNRSARMIERMERDGVVGPADGAKPREVLIRPLGQMPGA